MNISLLKGTFPLYTIAPDATLTPFLSPISTAIDTDTASFLLWQPSFEIRFSAA